MPTPNTARYVYMGSFKHGNKAAVNKGVTEFQKTFGMSGMQDGHCYDWLAALEVLDVPSVISYDTDTKKWVCKSQALLDFLSIVTNGDKKWLVAYFRQPGKFRTKILTDTDGRIRMMLLANAIEKAKQGDVSFSKHALDIIREFEKANPKRKHEESAETGTPRGLRDLDE